MPVTSWTISWVTGSCTEWGEMTFTSEVTRTLRASEGPGWAPVLPQVAATWASPSPQLFPS